MEKNLKEVYVIGNFNYEANDGSVVSINKGEIYVLLNKTNDKWWEVIPRDGVKSFYIPANHVEECSGSGCPNKFRTTPKSQTYCLGKHDKGKLMVAEKENHENSFYRKRSNSLESKLFLQKFTPLCSDIDLSSSTTDKFEVTRHRKPRLSKDIWARRKSWAIEDSKVTKLLCNGKSDFSDQIPLKEWKTSQINMTTCHFPLTNDKYQSDPNKYSLNGSMLPSMEKDNELQIEHIESVKKLKAKYEDCISKEIEINKPPLMPKNYMNFSAMHYDNSYSVNVDSSINLKTPCKMTLTQIEKNGIGVFNKIKKDLDDTFSEHDISSEELMGSSADNIDTSNSSIRHIDPLHSNESLGSFTTSPVYANLPLHSPTNPPSPLPGETPKRELFASWFEYEDTNGRKYYFNQVSKRKSWKPPRKNTKKMTENCFQSEDNYCDINNLPLPVGWRKSYDSDTQQVCFLPKNCSNKWFASSDHEGRIYFFEQNGTHSYWTLPDCLDNTHVCSQENISTRESLNRDSLQNRCTKSISLILNQPPRIPSENAKTTDINKSSTFPRLVSATWSATEDDTVVSLERFPFLGQKILKKGYLNCTKITENGRRLRKSWTNAYLILTDMFLIFFKDLKSASLMRPGSLENKPELCLDLHNANIEWTSEKSSRKNVFQISTMLELQVLLQHDSASAASEWVAAIHDTISISSRVQLTSSCHDVPLNKISPLMYKKSVKLSRSKSAKIKALSGSTEDLDITHQETQVRIRDRLRKFFNRRPTIESLKQKGIIKDEPVFGCDLMKLCAMEGTTVPLFVKNCIYAIESKEENMKTDGLYRASGNLSQVQKIRLQVDNNNYEILTHEEDVHVLTGCLKLFFREMKQPLLPSQLFEVLLKSAGQSDSQRKVQELRSHLELLPDANFNTLRFLLKHLLKVTEYSHYNRMHISNLAIVFGPTLMWSEQESANLALDMMQQNLVVESLLMYYGIVFR